MTALPPVQPAPVLVGSAVPRVVEDRDARAGVVDRHGRARSCGRSYQRRCNRRNHRRVPHPKPGGSYSASGSANSRTALDGGPVSVSAAQPTAIAARMSAYSPNACPRSWFSVATVMTRDGGLAAPRVRSPAREPDRARRAARDPVGEADPASGSAARATGATASRFACGTSARDRLLANGHAPSSRTLGQCPPDGSDSCDRALRRSSSAEMRRTTSQAIVKTTAIVRPSQPTVLNSRGRRLTFLAPPSVFVPRPGTHFLPARRRGRGQRR